MATQVEHLDNHTARLTVNVSAETMEKAMQAAAKRIAGQVNIPGFRKGKAPYTVVLKYFGPQAVLEEAMDKLSQDVYKQALEESKIEPYSPGEVEAFEPEPEVTIKFLVAKQPEVEIGAYRDVRVPYEATQVEDKEIDAAIERMRDARAVVEPVEREAQFGDKVKFKVYGEAIHDHGDHEHADEADKSETDAAADAILEANPEAHDHEEHDHEHDEEHEHGATVEEFIDEEMDDVLSEDANADLVPGFSAQVVGMKAGDEKSFKIMLPADFREAHYANHEVDFKVTVLGVQARSLPELDDEFAKTASNNEVETLADLRAKVRKDQQEASDRRYDTEYSDKVLDSMVSGASLKYPEKMVENTTNEILDSLDRNLRNSGLTLEYYMQVQKKSEADLRQDYRETALKRLQRSLVLGELARLEGVTVSRDDITNRVVTMAESFGDQKDAFTKMLMKPENQQSIALDLLTEATVKRIIAIGKCENPPLPEPTAAPLVPQDAPAEATETKSE